jgi:ParB family chromosome partitioning protein
MPRRTGNRLLQSGAVEAGLAQARQSQDWLDQERAERKSMLLSNIQPRPDGDSRKLKPYYLIELAESIASVGLIEPPVVDREGRLLDGGHRVAALQLLASDDPALRVQRWLELVGLDPGRITVRQHSFSERLQALPTLTSEQIPVMQLPFDGMAEPDRALAIETSANTQRRDYTRDELLFLVKRLRDAGYVEREGRPKLGEKALRPALSVILGKSPNTVRRWMGVLNDAAKTSPNGQVFAVQQAARKLLQAIQAYRGLVADDAGKVNETLLNCLDTAEALLQGAEPPPYERQSSVPQETRRSRSSKPSKGNSRSKAANRNDS